MRRIACRRQFSIAGTPTPVLSLQLIIYSESQFFKKRKQIFEVARFLLLTENDGIINQKWTFMKKNCLISIVSHDAAIIIIAWTWTGRGVASLFGLFCQIIIPWKWKGYFKTILFIGFNLNTHASTIAAYLARKLAFLSLNLVFLARRKANRALAASRRSSRSLW